MSKEEKDWDAEYAPEVSKRQNDVKGLLAKKDKKGALKAALVNPPVQSKNAQLKDDNMEIVYSVFQSLSSADCSGVVEGLSIDERDVLMKYIYRCMDTRGKATNYDILLKLHQLVANNGMGSVIRALADRKTV